MENYESRAYGKVCELAYGIDLKQYGMMTKKELDFLLDKAGFRSGDSVLEIGCGAGLIAAYIAEKTSARFTCIDISPKTIEWAVDTHKENERLKFEVLDVRKISGLPQLFDKILAVDSLYFVSDKIDGYRDALKTTLQDILARLKPGGVFIVFWSELPFFKPESRTPGQTQLGLCLNELSYTFEAYDLTENEIAFWKSFRNACDRYKDEFIAEGASDLYESGVSEADFFIAQAEKGELYRNLFIVRS